MTGDEWREKYEFISIDFQVNLRQFPGSTATKNAGDFHRDRVQRAIGAMDEAARRHGFMVTSSTEPQITGSPHLPDRDDSA